MASRRTLSVTSLAAAIALAGCASHPPSPLPRDARAERICAALDALLARKGYRVTRRTVREGVRKEALHLVLLPDYMHTYTTNPADEVFVRGSLVVTPTTSGRGWVRDELPDPANPASADLDAMRAWAAGAGSFADPRKESMNGATCELLACSLDKGAVAAVPNAAALAGGMARRVDVAVWVAPDGVPRRARMRYDGCALQEVDLEFSDVGIDTDPALPEAVKRLLWEPHP